MEDQDIEKQIAEIQRSETVSDVKVERESLSFKNPPMRTMGTTSRFDDTQEESIMTARQMPDPPTPTQQLEQVVENDENSASDDSDEDDGDELCLFGYSKLIEAQNKTSKTMNSKNALKDRGLNLQEKIKKKDKYHYGIGKKKNPKAGLDQS